MNEELQKAITEVFNSVINAKEFLLGEIPDYINQLLMWKAVYSGILFLSAMVVIFFSVKYLISYPSKRKQAIDRAFEAKQRGDSWCFYHKGSSVTSVHYDHIVATGGVEIKIKVIFAFLGVVVGSCLTNLDWLQIMIAPKVYLIEYAASIVK